MTKKKILSIGIIILFLMINAPSSYADSLDKIQILKISARDKQAIVKLEDGKMLIIKMGEEIIIRPEEEVSADAKGQSTDKKIQVKDDKGKSAKPVLQPGPVKKGNMLIRKAKVVEITADTIVLEEVTKAGAETIIMSLKNNNVQSSELKIQSKDNKGQSSKSDVRDAGSTTEIYRIRKQPDQQGNNLLRSQSSQNAERQQINDKLPNQGLN